jgi:hypothetical protein
MPALPSQRPSVRFAAGLLVLCGLLASVAAQARGFCVATAAELQHALDLASDGGPYVDENVTIQIVSGTYLTPGQAFTSKALETTSGLTIEGGFAPGCPGVARDASTTVLDGQGVNGVLILRRPHAWTTVRHLTLQNGNSDVGAGLQVNYDVTPTERVAVNHVIVRGNHASGAGGGMYLRGAAPAGFLGVDVRWALVVDNAAGDDGGASNALATSGGARVERSTIIGNSAAGSTVGGVTCGCPQACLIKAVYAWGNSTSSLHLFVPSSVACVDADVRTGVAPYYESSNLSAEPIFVDAAGGDYRVRTDSPGFRACLDLVPQDVDLDDGIYQTPGTSSHILTTFGAYGDVPFADAFDG